MVAEGIESQVQANELRRLGCTHAQGYLFSRPLSTTAVEEMLVANRPLGPKKVDPSELAAARNTSDLYYSSKPIEWPELVPVRAAAVQDSTPSSTPAHS